MAQEFLTTFLDDVDSVTLKPGEVSGRYTISINNDIVFDRKRDGGFPEIKQLKQIIRDKVAPAKSLGHADKH
jgi:selenoprotein W-related protein